MSRWVLLLLLGCHGSDTDESGEDTDILTPHGDLLGVWSDGGSGYDAAQFGGLDAEGALLAHGLFQGTFRIANGQPAETELFADGDVGYWVGKFVDRQMVWVRTLAVTTEMESFYGSVTPSGGIAVCGWHTGVLTAGAGEGDARTTDAGAGQQGFAAFFGPQGQVEDLFVITPHEPGGSAQIRACMRRPNGATVLGGDFEGDAVVGTGEAWQTAVSAQDLDTVVFEVSPAGALSWLTTITGPGGDVMVQFAPTSDGSLVLTGGFEQNAVFGPGPEEISLASKGGWDSFVARIGPDGAVQWAVGGGTSTEDDYGWGVAVGPDDEVAVVGLYHGIWGPPGATSYWMPTSEAAEGWVARYDAAGTLDWARSVTGELDEWLQGAHVLADGTVLATGVAAWGDGNEAGAPFTVSRQSDDAAVTFEPTTSYGHGVLAAWNRQGELQWAKWPEGPGSWGRFVTSYDDTLLWGGEFTETVTFGAGEANPQTLTAVGQYDIVLAWLQR